MTDSAPTVSSSSAGDSSLSNLGDGSSSGSSGWTPPGGNADGQDGGRSPSDHEADNLPGDADRDAEKLLANLEMGAEALSWLRERERRRKERKKKKKKGPWAWTKRLIVFLLIWVVLLFLLIVSIFLLMPLLISLLVIAGIAAVLGAGSEPTAAALADIPGPLLAIYQQAVTECEGLDWTVLAAIAKVESNHGRHGGAVVGADGKVFPPIIGIRLDGSNNTAVILDSDDGNLDGDTSYDRAVGPFQFIPTSWEIFGKDVGGGEGGRPDGVKDPQNFHDAASAAVAHLCPTGQLTNVRNALYGYNPSWDYVEMVLAKAEEYAAAPPPSTVTGPVGAEEIVTVRGIQVHTSIAGQVEQLLAAAEADGIVLRGWGWRDAQDQIRLRRQNCGPTEYDIYRKPSSQCSPPTAIPGRSMHERGLAIDFTHDGGSINSQSSEAFRWLRANAARYGLYNFPVEPWHWSTTGT